MSEEQGTETKESPVLENPEVEETTEVVEDPNVKAQALLETLGKLNVDSAEKLQNMAFASQQAGRYANDLGSERQKVQALEQRLAALEQTPKPQPQAQPQDEFGFGYEQPAQPQYATPHDVERIMSEQIGKYVQMQTQANQASLQEYSSIQGDGEYGAVKDLFEKHIANPQVQIAIQGRQTTLSREYERTKAAFYKNLALQSKKTLEEFISSGQKVATPEVPHVEQGSNVPSPGVTPAPTVIDNLNEVAKNSTGSDDDLDAMLAAMLPDGDLFLQPESEVREGRIER